MNKIKGNNSGFSLIELVVAIVILSIGMTAFITLIINTTKNSVDPQIRQQGNAIARAYLEEIMLNPFCDPNWDIDGIPSTPLNCPVDCSGATASVCDAGDICRVAAQGSTQEASRNLYDDVCDYDGLNDVGAIDQNGNPIGSLGDYTVDVQVNDAGVILNSLDGSKGEVVLINVDVTHSTGATMNLSSYKTNF